MPNYPAQTLLYLSSSESLSLPLWMDIEYFSNLFSTWVFVHRESTAPQYLSPAPLLCIYTEWD